MSADAAGVLRAGLEQGLAAYEEAQAAYDALIDGCHKITPEYLQQEVALEAARDAALCALPARSELARMLLRALAAQAEAGAVAEVWVHENRDVNLCALRGRFTPDDLTWITEDMENNPPSEQEASTPGLYHVSVEWDSAATSGEWPVPALMWASARFDRAALAAAEEVGK